MYIGLIEPINNIKQNIGENVVNYAHVDFVKPTL